MELIKEIYESDLDINGGNSNTQRSGKPFWFRRAVRAVVFNENGEVALLQRRNQDYYKLPGGEVLEGETMEAALKRATLEDIGADVELTHEAGLIIEYRDEHELLQFSYGYIGRAKKRHSQSQQPEEQHSTAIQPVWLPLHDAIERMQQNKPITYMGKFIQVRDICFLKQLQR
ncbi:NUDIX hydrolase [Paenibacillus sp. GCM10027627]|uniref:NUDIX hydrolase n=1 Tax=unclassified Paenibacillus TaxID=185978 RepID=UPI00362CDCD9